MVKKVVKEAEQAAEAIVKPGLVLTVKMAFQVPHDCLDDFGSVTGAVRKAATMIEESTKGQALQLEISQ